MSSNKGKVGYLFIYITAALKLCEAVSTTGHHSQCWAPQVHQVCNPEVLCHYLHGILSGAFCSAEASQVGKQE